MIGLQIFVVPIVLTGLQIFLCSALPQTVQGKVGEYDSVSRAENNQYGPLSSQELVELIKKSAQDSGFRGDQSDEESRIQGRNNEELNDNNLDGDFQYVSNIQLRDKYRDDQRFKDSRFNELALEELLSHNVLNRKYKKKHRKTVKPHNLVGSYDFDSVNTGNNNEKSYSKVYVILNPKAIAESKNRDQFNNLLEKILSLSVTFGKEQGGRIRDRRYKGFSVNPGLLSRRARRESRDTFVDMESESLEDLKPNKPKPYQPYRPRGGGGGGRTAIPYSNRGDIYEKNY